MNCDDSVTLRFWTRIILKVVILTSGFCTEGNSASYRTRATVFSEQGTEANGDTLILYFLKILFHPDVSVKTGFPEVNRIKTLTL